jgi:hypothetical protein
MQYLALFFVTVFGVLFKYIAKFIGQRAALGAVLTVAIVGASLVLYVLVQALVTGLIFAIDNEYFLMAFYMVWPSNASLCITACLTTDLAIFIYRHKVRLMMAMALAG